MRNTSHLSFTIDIIRIHNQDIKHGKVNIDDHDNGNYKTMKSKM